MVCSASDINLWDQQLIDQFSNYGELIMELFN